jgi:hypothetical protein
MNFASNALGPSTSKGDSREKKLCICFNTHRSRRVVDHAWDLIVHVRPVSWRRTDHFPRCEGSKFIVGTDAPPSESFVMPLL